MALIELRKVHKRFDRLVVLNGVLAMSELAVVSAKRSRLEQKAADGSEGAKVALELGDEPERLFG